MTRGGQAAIVATSQAGYTLTTIISGNGGGTVDISLGVRGEGDVKKVFREQLQGVYPGKSIEFVEEADIKNTLKAQAHGGVLTGIPTQKVEEEKQTFGVSYHLGRNRMTAISPGLVRKTRLVRQLLHEPSAAQ